MKRSYFNYETGVAGNLATMEKMVLKTNDEKIAAILNNSGLTFVFDINDMHRELATELFVQNYVEVDSDELDNPFRSKLDKGSFVVVGGSDILCVRIKTFKNKAITLYDLKAKLGAKATVKNICSKFDTTDELIGMAQAIERIEDLGHTGITAPANAFNDFKFEQYSERTSDGSRRFCEKEFRKDFPLLSSEVHDFVMKSFQGGLCLVNENYKGRFEIVGNAYDVNSMYPSVMMNEKFPTGKAVPFTGKYESHKKDFLGFEIEGLYFQKVRISSISLKEGHYACIKSQADIWEYDEEYITNQTNVELILNSVDLEILEENYDVDGITYLGGYSFDATHGEDLFGKFINKWMKIKVECEKAGDEFGRFYAKLMLNSCYGKFATRTDKKVYHYVRTPNGITRTAAFGKKQGSAVYAPVGAYITSYARKKLLQAINNNKESYLYGDTDSIYVKGEAKGIEIDANKLGAWKKEFSFKNMAIVGKKMYCVEKLDGKVKTVLAGVPDEEKDALIRTYCDFTAENIRSLYKIVKRIIDASNKNELEEMIEEIDEFELRGDVVMNLVYTYNKETFSFVEMMRWRMSQYSALEALQGEGKVETVEDIMEEALAVVVEEEPEVITEETIDRSNDEPFDFEKAGITEDNPAINLTEKRKSFLAYMAEVIPYINSLEEQLGYEDIDKTTFDWDGIIYRPIGRDIKDIINEHLDEYQRIIEEMNCYIDNLSQHCI